MILEDLNGRLRSGCTLFLDTNVVWGRGLTRLADLVNGWNEHKVGGGPVRMELCPIAYAERQARERRFRLAECKQFDEEVVRSFLDSKKVSVPSLTWDDAERISAWLFDRAVTDSDWQALKGNKVASADWFIAGHAIARGALVVTGDRGVEFDGVERVSKAVLISALKALLESTQASS